MKYIDEFRDGDLARKIADRLNDEAQGRSYSFMEFCGGHTHAISRYGLKDLLPANVEMVHGPGCPVCVLPIGRIDSAMFRQLLAVLGDHGIGVPGDLAAALRTVASIEESVTGSHVVTADYLAAALTVLGVVVALGMRRRG